jgi:hypothetical protein
MHGMIRDLKMRPAEGGFIICYDKFDYKSQDEYEGMEFIGKKEIVVEDPKEAIEKLMELYSLTEEGQSIMNGKNSALGGA